MNLIINNKSYQFSIDGAPPFTYGKRELLSNAETDITFNQTWYSKGYKAFNFLDIIEFKNLKKGLTSCIKNIISIELGVPIDSFKLDNYHNYIKTNEDHYKVVSKTRDLFPIDFNFPIMKLLSRFEKILGFQLTDINPKNKQKLHIIVRINRPFSNDFNPPHKDIYEAIDATEPYIPQFINLWIPICGVTQNSSLPVSPSSHLLKENVILRTKKGGVIEGNKYRVRMIKQWEGKNKLIRSKVNYGEVLFFSPHLIHGLAINEEKHTTRVSLEFRLFKQPKTQ